MVLPVIGHPLGGASKVETQCPTQIKHLRTHGFHLTFWIRRLHISHKVGYILMAVQFNIRQSELEVKTDWAWRRNMGFAVQNRKGLVREFQTLTLLMTVPFETFVDNFRQEMAVSQFVEG